MPWGTKWGTKIKSERYKWQFMNVKIVSADYTRDISGMAPLPYGYLGECLEITKKNSSYEQGFDYTSSRNLKLCFYMKRYSLFLSSLSVVTYLLIKIFP